MRPTKRTPAVATIVLDFISQGASKGIAAAAAGISADTLSRWIADDLRFGLKVAQAEAGFAMSCVSRIGLEIDNGRDGAKTALAWLERRYPNEWRPSPTPPVQSPVQIVISYDP